MTRFRWIRRVSRPNILKTLLPAVGALSAVLQIGAAWANPEPQGTLPAAATPSEITPAAPEWQRLGLLRVRDMTPFGLTRLDFMPAHAIVAPPGTFAIETNLSYQNTWARSDNVERYLRSRGLMRTDLGPADINSIMALPGDAYLVDGEYGLLDLTLHYRASRHFGLYATVPFQFFNEGGLDGAIEGFHNSFGFSNAGRDFVPRNRWRTILKLRDTSVVSTETPHSDFGDPVFGVRYSLKEHPGTWNIIMEAAAKIAFSNEQLFVSTGSSDYGLQVSLQRFFPRNAFYLTVSEVYYASPDRGLSSDRWIPTAVAGWETRLTKRLGFVVQLYASQSTVRETNLEELRATKLQATMGVQWLYRGQVLRVGVTENLANFNNTPDVGLTVSVGRIFGNAAR